MKRKPELYFVLLFVGIAVYVGRGAVLGEWGIPRSLRIVFAAACILAYALRGDHRQFIYE